MTQELLADAVAPWRGMTREQYDALVATGALEGAPVELLEGVLAEVSPQGDDHREVVLVTSNWLLPKLPPPWLLAVQLPLAATDRSEPEPDLAVVQRRSTGRTDAAALVVEVAVSSQRLDLGLKARVYAEAGVPEYWVVDVPAREVVVHTEPGPTGYRLVRRQPWTALLRVPVDPPVEVDLATLLAPPG